jgi:hypothetical protein
MSGPEELEKIDHWRWGSWQEADDYLPPFDERVVASDGKEIWLDMRLESLPDLGWKGKRAKYWCPFESLMEFLQEKHRQELAAQRAAEEPDATF